jgi:D-arabinose 1-dehydrogenase-like Zn-dependent alcohol dehydrogenase
VLNPDLLPGEALIRVRAFGLVHAETHMHKGEWGRVAPNHRSGVRRTRGHMSRR